MQLQQLPYVSVIIPAFNEEKYILQSLKALLNQDYPFYEIIITDNASTDATYALVKKFIETGFLKIPVMLIKESKQGTNFARESARKMATGSVIAQMDADCIPDPGWIRKGVASLLKGKRVAVTGPYYYFDGEKWMRHFSLLSQKICYPLTNYIVQLTGRAAILIGGNAFIRAQVLEEIGGYNTSLTFYGDDVDMGKRLSKIGEVTFVNSLIQFSSSRRYKAHGFWEDNKKYQEFFWNLVWHKDNLLQTAESSHPR